MPRLKQKARSNPSSQPLDEGGLDSASSLTPITVAAPNVKTKMRAEFTLSEVEAPCWARAD